MADEPKLTPAEVKKKAKAEKQARRAKEKDEQGKAVGGPATTTNDTSAMRKQEKLQGGGSVPNQKSQGGQQHQQSQQIASSGQIGTASHKRTGSQQASMPLRRRPSLTGPVKEKIAKKDNKEVTLFSHLYSQPRRTSIEGTSKDVHPAVLALGFQMSSYTICGSNARCVAMLLAFKEAIQAYITPAGTSLARHLTSHYLSPQIDFLKSCRPISESMGNAIRWLKKLIIEIDPSKPEKEAKDDLCNSIDTFIRERITVADTAIASTACREIRDGAVLLTYAKSSIIEKTILKAHTDGIHFSVIVVDSRPLFEGKNLVRCLMNAGLEVQYMPFSGISHAMQEATLVLLGAHSMLSNGRLQSRVGTAAIAMQAYRSDVPVIVCCESVKFTSRVALDSIVLNEVALADELLLPTPERTILDKADPKGDDDGEKEKTFNDWKDIPNLQILNLMYDVTPAEYIKMVICEYGSLPPSSVPVVYRLTNEGF